MTRESLKPNIFPPDSKNYGSVSLQIPDVDDLDDNDLYNINEDTNTSERLSIIFKFSYPVILAFLLSVSGNCIILYFAGYISHLGDDTATFGGVSLAITFTNITLSSVVDGLSTAVETLSSQYNGAKNYRMVGLVLNRSIIVLLLISLPIMVIWLYFDTIFTLIGISHDMIAVVGEFISWRFLSVPVEVLNLSYEKYLMSMGIMQPSLKACCLFNVSLVLMNYIFVCVLECGVRGIALAYVLSMCMELATLVLLSVNHPCVKRTLVAPDSESFQELGSFLLFGLSGCVMLCAEWWAYEILILFAGVLGESAVAAQSVLMQLLVISFMFPLGIGISASTLVGNALGAGKIDLAKEIAHLSLKVMVGVSCVICPAMAMGGHFFMSLFTTDADVLAICSSTLKYLVYSAFVDGLQGVSSGILRGAGKQHIGAITNVIAFYVIGLPCAWLLCFELDFGVHGLMIGILLGSSFQTAVLLFFLLFRESYVFRQLEAITTPTTSRHLQPQDNGSIISELESLTHSSGVVGYTISSSHGALAPNHMLIPGV